jgi:hypothetical protein
MRNDEIRTTGLSALIQLLETHDGTTWDSRYDEAIALAAGWDQDANGDWHQVGDFFGDGLRRTAYAVELPPFTRSLDAAASLVPAGCLWMARTLWDGGGKTASGCASVTRYSPAPDRMWIMDYSGNADTTALALCAAALRAHVGMMEPANAA